MTELQLCQKKKYTTGSERWTKEEAQIPVLWRWWALQNLNSNDQLICGLKFFRELIDISQWCSHGPGGSTYRQKKEAAHLY